MNRSRFSEFEKRFALTQVDKGASIRDVCYVFGISQATFYNWKNQLTESSMVDMDRLQNLENENRRLREKLTELEKDKQMLITELNRRR